MSWRHDRDLQHEAFHQAVRADEFIWQRSRALGISRRRLLQWLAAGGASVVVGGAWPQRIHAAQEASSPDVVVKPTPPELFFDYGSNKEMRWNNLSQRGYVVPKDVMPEGLDDLKVRRPIPVTKAMTEDTLLAYAMNGEPLPPDHGFPVRMLVPGWIGAANIKWVGRLEVSEEALFSPWNVETYIFIGSDYQPTPPAKGLVLSMQNLKSALELDMGAQLPAGRHLMTGRSWSPFGKITQVEYSLDRGVTWQQARLEEPRIAPAWVRWAFDWDARPGHYTIRVRAADEHGHVQPDRVPWNEQGYLYNAVVDHPVVVV
jgi:hypothetical protein